MRHTARAALFAATLLLALAGGAAATAAGTDPTPTPTGGSDLARPTGPSVVEVPFESTLDVKPAPGWAFADCAPIVAASALVTTCAADGFTVASAVFDPELAPVRVTVPLTNGMSTLAVDYIIRLAAPTPPDAGDTDTGIPVPAGSRLLIPFSDLGLTCGLCTPGTAEVEVVGIDPASAGTARVTGTHLTFAAAPGARGRAEIAVRVTDDIGASSKVLLVTVHVVAADTDSVIGLHLLRPAEPLALEIADLGFAVGTEEELRIVGCGAALRGLVSCSPDGTVAFTPAGDGPDQFSVRLSTPNGRQAIASVTLGTTDAAALAPATGTASAPLTLILPRPVESSEEQAGATSNFTKLMDGLGAR